MVVDVATKEMRKRFAVAFLSVIISAALVASIALWYFLSLGITLITVKGESMVPTFSDGQIVALKQADKVEKGMIVVFPKPESWSSNNDNNPELIKRLWAGGGSIILYDGERLFVDGEIVYDLKKDDYSCSLKPGYTHTLSGEEIFVMGDNRQYSLDSLRILCDGEGDPYVDFLTVVTYGEVEGGS